jgi:hypothetical protein
MLVATFLWLWLSGRRSLALLSALAMGVLLLPWYFHRSWGSETLNLSTVTMVGERPADAYSITERVWEIISVSIPYSITPLFPSFAAHINALGPLLSVITLVGMVLLLRREGALHVWLTTVYLWMIIFFSTWETVRFTLVLTPIVALAWVAATTTPLATLLAKPTPVAHRTVWSMAILMALIPASLSITAAKRFVAIFRHPPYHDALLPAHEHDAAADFQALLAWEREQNRPDAVWVDAYPKGLYVHTQRKSAPYDNLENPSAASLVLLKSRPCWLVVRSGYWGETPIRTLVTQHPERVKLLFTSPHNHLRVYQWLHPKNSTEAAPVEERRS